MKKGRSPLSRETSPDPTGHRFIVLAERGRFGELLEMISQEPGLKQLTEIDIHQLLIISSRMPGMLDLIKRIYNLNANQYLTSTGHREINPVFRDMLKNALKNSDTDLFKFLITRQPMCSGHSRYLLQEVITSEKAWAMNMLMSEKTLTIDDTIVLKIIKSRGYGHAHKMIDRLSLEDNGKVLFNLVYDSLSVKLSPNRRENNVALLFKLLDVGVLDTRLFMLIQGIAVKTQHQSKMSAYEMIVLGMLLATVQRERTIDLPFKSDEQCLVDSHLFVENLGFEESHPWHAFIASGIHAIDRWVMSQRSRINYKAERGATFVAGTDSQLQRRYYFMGMSDNFFQAFVGFLKEQSGEKELKELLQLIGSGGVLKSMYNPRVAGFLENQGLFAVPGSADRIHSHSVPTISSVPRASSRSAVVSKPSSSKDTDIRSEDEDDDIFRMDGL